MTGNPDAYLNNYCLLVIGGGVLVVVPVAFVVAQVGAVATACTRDWIALLVEFHPEVKSDSVQDLFDFIERLLAQILGGQHFTFAALYQISERSNVSILQTIVGTD